MLWEEVEDGVFWGIMGWLERRIHMERDWPSLLNASRRHTAHCEYWLTAFLATAVEKLPCKQKRRRKYR